MVSKDPQQVALVTGTSSGIGHAVAKRLAESGYRVFGTSRRAAAGTTVDGIEMLPLDITDEASVEKSVAEVLERAGRLDLLVNNAGIGVSGAAEESSAEQALQIFDTNVFGVMRMTRAVLPHMRSQRRGRIVNISSVLGFIPAPYMALYASTKHAIEGYSESLDHELREYGIRVALIQPAYIKTSFDQNMVSPDAALETYASARHTYSELLTEVVKIADDPQIVADAVYAAATDRKPRVRYPAGKLAKRVAVLRRFAPVSVVDKNIRKQNRLA